MPSNKSIALFQHWFNYYLKTNPAPIACYLAYRRSAKATLSNRRIWPAYRS